MVRSHDVMDLQPVVSSMRERTLRYGRRYKASASLGSVVRSLASGEEGYGMGYQGYQIKVTYDMMETHALRRVQFALDQCSVRGGTLRARGIVSSRMIHHDSHFMSCVPCTNYSGSVS